MKAIAYACGIKRPAWEHEVHHGPLY